MSTIPPAGVISATLRLTRRETLAPSMLRIYLSGDDAPRFADATVGLNNKVLIPPPGVDEVHFPTRDPVTGRQRPADIAVRPAMRTYTHRGYRADTNEVFIDVVLHDQDGPAAQWARHAPIGAPIGVLMKAGPAELCVEAPSYVLAADGAGLPVLAAILESRAEDATGEAYIEIPHERERIELQHPRGMTIHWLVTPPDGESPLPAAIRANPRLRSSESFAYVAAEYRAVKAIRGIMREVHERSPKSYYAYSYWKRGVAEDRSEVDRRAERDSAKAEG